MLNVEYSAKALDELTENFRYNDAVIRNMVIRRDEAVTEQSDMLKPEDTGRGERRERRERSDDDSDNRNDADDSSDDDAAADAGDDE